jgi:hypothetical protein
LLAHGTLFRHFADATTAFDCFENRHVSASYCQQHFARVFGTAGFAAKQQQVPQYQLNGRAAEGGDGP